MLSRFWSESFWLPANTTWEDISNGPGKAIVYAEAKDYWVQIPLVICMLTLRFLSEGYVFAPLGRYLKISDFKGKKPYYSAKLEAAYSKSPKNKNATSLAKELELSEREIERWWRLRRRQDKPSTLVKFCENLWRGCSYTFNTLFGLYVIWGQEWARDVELCFAGYPHQGITPDIWWFYMVASAFYISLIITQFRDVRRKDFWQMFIHHFGTIALLYCSWVSQAFRIGCLVLILHDVGDVVLEFGKAAKYARYQRTVDCMFAVFVCLWVVSRLVLLPVYILPIAYARPYDYHMYLIMNLLMWLLFVLSLFWTWLILKMVLKTINSGQFGNDARSSESEESDVARISHDNSNGIILKSE